MKYRVITYRSRKLKHSTMIFDDLGADDSAPISGFDDVDDEDEYDDDEEEVRLTRRERRAQKKQLKKEKKENEKKFRVGDEEYNEDDFDPEEVEDMRASEMMNKDGFYDPLEPIDSGEERVREKKSARTYLIIGAATLVVVGIIIFSIMFIMNNT